MDIFCDMLVGNMPGNKKIQEKILRLSEGVLSTAVDAVLYFAAFSAQMLLPQRPYGAAARASETAISFLEEVNYQTIKRALGRAREKGWLASPGKGKRMTLKITEAGKKRLKSILPFYEEKRVWDGCLYLVTYDIPESQKTAREIFREYLRKIGCGMLQKSVWLTPYNPAEVLRKFIQERELKGAVIISCLGRDGSIGQEDIKSLVFRIYKLERINQQYKDFLQEYQGGSKDRVQALFNYLSILGNDPQLPFELLPDDWLGEEAYKLYKTYFKGRST